MVEKSPTFKINAPVMILQLNSLVTRATNKGYSGGQCVISIPFSSTIPLPSNMLFTICMYETESGVTPNL